MAASSPASQRARALGLLAALVLALVFALVRCVGRESGTSVVAVDPPLGTSEGRAPSATEIETAPRAPRLQSEAPALAPRRTESRTGFAPLDGFVVDDRTGELVPHVTVRLIHPGGTESVLVGADARFVAPSGAAFGEVTVVVHDDGLEIGRARTTHAGIQGTRGWRVEVPIGPTIHIAAIDQREVEPAQWRARLRESALEQDEIGIIDVEAGGLSVRAPSSRLPDRDWSWIRVREGPTAWARYPRVEHEPQPGVDARVELRNESDRRKGSAPVARTLGVQRTVTIQSRPYGRVEVSISRRPEFAADPMLATLVDTEPPDRGPSIFDEVVVPANGRVVFDDLESGTKELMAWSRGESAETAIRLATGAAATEQIGARRVGRGSGRHALHEFPEVRRFGWSGGPERAVVSSNRRARRSRAWVSPIGDPDEWSVIAPFHTPNDARARFVAATVPLVRLDGAGASEPPAKGLTRHAFRVLAGAGEHVVSGVVAFGPEGTLLSTRAQPTGFAFDVPTEAAFTWSVWVEGMQPVWGGASAFRQSEDGVRIATVRVTPGTGFELHLRAGDPEVLAEQTWPWVGASLAQDRAEVAALGGPPIANVKLAIDTYASGASDMFGALYIAHPILPRELELGGKGWRLCALDALPGAGRRYVAWLRRNP